MLIEATGEIASRITGAIRKAAHTTGASFEYLLKTAQRESNFNPAAKAATSSATGLFQFIEQTWLQTLKRAGPALGYGQYAEGIVRTDTGRYVVPDPARRQEIMRLRTDPAASSAMAGAFTQRNAEILTARLGRQPTDGELYIAHFLGPTGAVQLISAATETPQAPAAPMFPRAARANRSIFYVRGAPRTAGQVYGALVAKHQNTESPLLIAAPTRVADKARATPAAAVPAAAAPLLPAAAYAAEPGPVFHNLFHTERAAPVSAVVAELWSPKSPPAPSISESSLPRVGGPMRLFEFLRPEIRAQARRSA